MSLEELQNLTFGDFLNKLVGGIVEFTIHLAVAVLVFCVGRFIIRKIHKVVGAIFVRRQLDLSLSVFILNMIDIVLYFVLIIIVVGILGIETSSFLALFASAGVAVGLALSGTLQNFAGGVLILLLKPYRIGDFIEAQGYSGTVKAIQLFNTVIVTPDNKQIIIPNGSLSTGTINNSSKESYRRVEWTISLSYGTDVAKAKDAILELLTNNAPVVLDAEKEIEEYRREHKDIVLPPLKNPFVGLDTLGASSIDFKVRAWVKSGAYWDVYFNMNEVFYSRLTVMGFSFPFPQLDVHLKQ